MGFCTYCTNRDPKEKKDRSKIDEPVDLNNQINPEMIQDEHQRFKYLFPFYRMDIQVFQQKMEKIQGIQTKSFDTQIITLEQLKTEFGSEAWREMWTNVDKLLKVPEFKVVAVKDLQVIQNFIPWENLINCTSKLEIGILALIWCEGSMQQKASFFTSLLNTSLGSKETISSDSEQLRFIFVKIMEYSTDLPLRYDEVFDDVTSGAAAAKQSGNGVGRSEQSLEDADLFSIGEIVQAEVPDLELLDQKYSEEQFFKTWLIDELEFDKNAGTLNVSTFNKKMASEHFEWIYDSDAVRERVLVTLQDDE